MHFEFFCCFFANCSCNNLDNFLCRYSIIKDTDLKLFETKIRFERKILICGKFQPFKSSFWIVYRFITLVGFKSVRAIFELLMCISNLFVQRVRLQINETSGYFCFLYYNQLREYAEWCVLQLSSCWRRAEAK